MTVEVPDNWKALWEAFDRRFDELKEMVRSGGGVSSQDVSVLMRVGLGGAPLKTPAWTAWAAIKHNAATTYEIRDAILKCVGGSDGEAPQANGEQTDE